MTTTALKTIALSAIFGAAAMTLASTVVFASDAGGMDKPAMEKCYGVAKVGKNDCKSGAHDCAGHSTKDMDKATFVEGPAGLCAKLSHGTTTAM